MGLLSGMLGAPQGAPASTLQSLSVYRVYTGSLGPCKETQKAWDRMPRVSAIYKG